MGAPGSYSSTPASRATLRAAFRQVFGLAAAAAAAGEPAPTGDQVADALADAVATWLAGVPVVVRVRAPGDPLAPFGDLALQTGATPGSPTLPPPATVELGGTLSIGGA